MGPVPLAGIHRGGVGGQRGAVVRGQLVGSLDPVDIAGCERVGGAADFEDRDLVALQETRRALLELEHVREFGGRAAIPTCRAAGASILCWRPRLASGWSDERGQDEQGEQGDHELRPVETHGANRLSRIISILAFKEGNAETDWPAAAARRAATR